MADIADEVYLADIDSLIPYQNNPKRHPDEQVQKIASSIKNFGWDQPIVVDSHNEIIKGHGRLAAAKLLELDEVPVIKRADLTDAEAKASRIADNKAQVESGFDYDSLSTEFKILSDRMSEQELSDMTGFDEMAIDDLLERDGGSVDDFQGLEEYPFQEDPVEPEGDEQNPQGEQQQDTPPETVTTSNGNKVTISGDEEGTSVEANVVCPECGHEYDL